jgi:carboxyl-terminal processing protease
MENSNKSQNNYEDSALYNNKVISDKTTIKNFGLVIAAVALFVIGVITGRSVDADKVFNFDRVAKNSKVEIKGDTKGEGLSDDIDFNLYWEVWSTISDRYVDSSKTDEKLMFYNSVKGMVTAYEDPHTIFLSPEETESFNDSSSGNFFSGIGAELGYEGGWPIIVTPLKGSPALAAGIKAGDKIMKVDDYEVSPNDSIFDLVTKVRGERGTDVVLTVLHRGDSTPVEITITRADITIPSMELEIEDGYAILELSRFTESTTRAWQEKWDAAVKQVGESKAKGLIIDLRGNPGGYMDSAIYAAGEFLPEGKIVMQQEDRNGHVREHKVLRKGKLQNIPVIILINEGSASASEILAGALQKNNRATVIGVESFGKGTAQDVVEFADGSSLHVTVLKWLLPDGKWISEENKVVPDIKVERTDDDFKAGLDPQMDRALVEIAKMKAK